MKLFFNSILLIYLAFIPLKGMSGELLPDFKHYQDTKEKKQAFFNYLLPKIKKVNAEILAERQFILENQIPSWPLTGKWKTLAKKYRITDVCQTPEQVRALLLRRVDVIPPSLALAQAAHESSWGTSRFATDAYNLFGQWCFTPGCGLVPQKRQTGKIHEVRKFDSPTASVRSYMLNLNSHKAFKMLRDIRQSLRTQDEVIEGKKLAAGLIKYSERSQDYIKDVKSFIRYNNLTKFDKSPGKSS